MKFDLNNKKENKMYNTNSEFDIINDSNETKKRKETKKYEGFTLSEGKKK